MRRIALALLPLAIGCGNYDGTFRSNPDQPRPAGAGSLEVSESTLVFSDLRVGNSKMIELVVRNVSADYALDIVRATVEDDVDEAFYAQEEDFVDVRIAPGRELRWGIVCTLPAEDKSEALFRIVSNDSDTPSLDVALVGTPWGWVEDTDTGE